MRHRTMYYMCINFTNGIDDVFSLQFSDGFTLSWHELNAIILLYLTTHRQTWIEFLYFCILAFCILAFCILVFFTL